MNCAENIVAFGDPGTGKYFITQYSVLYALSQGLNTISLLLMVVHKNTLRGIHLCKICFLPTKNKLSSPFIYAEKAIEEMKKNNKIYHAILTLDILFIDELGQFRMIK